MNTYVYICRLGLAAVRTVRGAGAHHVLVWHLGKVWDLASCPGGHRLRRRLRRRRRRRRRRQQTCGGGDFLGPSLF